LALDEETFEPLLHSWLFLVAPLIGACIAAFYYSWFHLASTTNTGIFAPKAPKKEEVKSEAPKDKDAK